jgi:hypothetical protein
MRKWSTMPLFKDRKRLATIDKAEQAGESFWTTEFDYPSWARIWHAFSDASAAGCVGGPRTSPLSRSSGMKVCSV